MMSFSLDYCSDQVVVLGKKVRSQPILGIEHPQEALDGSLMWMGMSGRRLSEIQSACRQAQ
jgi:hypothetical protein